MVVSRRAPWIAAAHVAAAALGVGIVVAVLREPEKAAALQPAPPRLPPAPAGEGSSGPPWRPPAPAASTAPAEPARGAVTALPVASKATAAVRHGALGSAACAGELRRRGVPHAPAPKGAPDVRDPLRLTGPVRSVAFHGAEPAKARPRSPFEIADCRLAVALDDLAGILAAHGVVEVVHMSMHRPSARRPGGKPSQHQLGLAIDVGAFVKADGSRLDVRADWHGAIGSPPCGPGSEPRPSTPAALELRAIVCAIRDAALFNVILTPNHDAAHADHVHLDLTPGATWFELE